MARLLSTNFTVTHALIHSGAALDLLLLLATPAVDPHRCIILIYPNPLLQYPAFTTFLSPETLTDEM
jgi:hypothetical protein